MVSISRHHADWLSLLEISGPFLSLPVLMKHLPQGLDAHDPELRANLQAAHEEWADNQAGLTPDPALHTAWVNYVFENALRYKPEILLEGQAIPTTTKAEIPEQGITLFPDIVLVEPTDKKKARMLIKVYPPQQELDNAPIGSKWKSSVGTQMMELLHATNVKLGLITNGEQWMLVHAPVGETTTFVSWYAYLWFDESLTLRALSSLLEARRLFGVPENETLEALLAESSQDQHEVTDQLGFQVRQAVEILIRDLDRADIDRGRKLLADVSEERLYEAALTVMMRLVFLFSAEERKLLPIDDPLYAENYAISTLRAHLREQADQHGEDVLERHTDAWNRLLATFRALYAGVNHDRMNLMAYGGSLFDPDRFPFLEGREAGTSWKEIPSDPLPVDNRTILHLLEALQILKVNLPGGGGYEARRLSFRALDVEQIGHVYEGLLDHTAKRAREPMLSFQGTQHNNPELAISELEAQHANGEEALNKYIKDETGRSASAIKNGLAREIDPLRAQRLRAACNNNDALYQRSLPFADLVRDDDIGFPIVIPANSIYVTRGTTRRSTGTHYTPRSLTEPIVQHTLESLVYVGPAEGNPKEEWKLRTPEEILDLKVCDMAMGSGAFLVQACRYLSERLVESWEQFGADKEALDRRAALREQAGIQPHEASKTPIDLSASTEDERLAIARRLVVDRCLNGVDKNPLAVEMAKLSLWLITLDKTRPFTFLNHALKCGDSLVGATKEEYLNWGKRQSQEKMVSIFEADLQKRIDLAIEKRKELQAFQVIDVRDAERKQDLLEEADATMAHVLLGCDLVTGTQLMGLNSSEAEDMQLRLLQKYLGGSLEQDFEEIKDSNSIRAINKANQVKAFHWEFEYPEVFNQGGFTAIIGNPPFLGGRRIIRTLGEKYQAALQSLFKNISKNADLCTFFFVKADHLVTHEGQFTFIATKTIAEGDTRESGLAQLIDEGSIIVRASTLINWPGKASVLINIVQISKRKSLIKRILNDIEVDNISSFLRPEDEQEDPYKLISRETQIYTGAEVHGKGFILTEEEAKSLINKNPSNKEVVRKYINGRTFCNDPGLSHTGWVIFFFDKSEEDAKRYFDSYQIVKTRVKPKRMESRRASHRKYWWQFGEKRPALFASISKLERVLATARVSKHIIINFLPTDFVFLNTLHIFPMDDFAHFALLQSNIHSVWALRRASSVGVTPQYTPLECYYNFPFPDDLEIGILPNELVSIGELYYKTRTNIVGEMQLGLTAIYNYLHDPDNNSETITRMRDIQVNLDYIILGSYGWEDISLDHDFYETPQGVRFTLGPEAKIKIVKRILKLNHQHHQEETEVGLHGEKEKKPRKKKKPKKETPKEQVKFLGMVEKEIPSAQIALDSVPGDQIGNWDQCVCIGCGKTLVGFMIAEHIEKVHGGKVPSFRKVEK